MGWILSLLLFLPQGLPQQAPGVVLSGQLTDGRLPLKALGLGEGGVVEASPPPPVHRGTHVSPGGVVVQARREGVKLSFPTGVELLFSRTGFLHLRGGEQKGSFRQGLELFLADGTSVCVWLGASRRPLRRVEVRQGGRAMLLWHRDAPRREVVRPRPSSSPQLLVLGEGDAIYRAVPWGPLIAMERMLCNEEQRSLPERYLVIVADALGESLGHLPRKFSRKAVEFPEATEISAALSKQAADVFGEGRSGLQRVEADFLRFGMGTGFELSLHVSETGPLLLSLHRGEDARILVEWTIGNSTELHMVRPHGGTAEEPRYFRSGLPVGEKMEPVTSLRSGYHEQEDGRRMLRAMGGVPLKPGIAAKPGR